MCQAGPRDGSGEAVLRRGGDSSQKPRDPEGRLCLLRNAPPTGSGRRLSEQEVQAAVGRGLGGPQTVPRPQATPDPLLPTPGASILLSNALGAPHLPPTSLTPVTCHLVHPR